MLFHFDFGWCGKPGSPMILCISLAPRASCLIGFFSIDYLSKEIFEKKRLSIERFDLLWFVFLHICFWIASSCPANWQAVLELHKAGWCRVRRRGWSSSVRHRAGRCSRPQNDCTRQRCSGALEDDGRVALWRSLWVVVIPAAPADDGERWIKTESMGGEDRSDAWRRKQSGGGGQAFLGLAARVG